MITGADTGVGKTLIACALAAEFRRLGLRVGVMKPVETGVSRSNPSDALLLKRFSECRFPIHAICPYRFRAPLAPWVAARLEGKRISLEALRKMAQSISRSHDITIIEGAGGLLVPLTRRHTYRDLALSLGLPMVIVARLGLGTINHTLLTLEAARRRGLHVLGIVLNDTDGRPARAERHNPLTLRQLAQAPILGVFPHLSGANTPPHLASRARRHLRVQYLLDSL